MRKKVLEIIDNVIAHPFRSQIHGLLKECIYCTYTGLTDEIFEPVSKFGGLPSLPPLMDWPEIEGRPLDFVAQFQLESLKKASSSVNIKDCGLLSFFYDDINRECGTNHRVFLFTEEQSKTLVERKPTKPSAYTFPQVGYSFKEGISIPNSLEDIGHPLYEQIESSYVDVIGGFYCISNDLFGDYDQFGGYTSTNYEPIPQSDDDLVVQFNSVSDSYHYLIPVQDGYLALDEVSVYYTTS